MRKREDDSDSSETDDILMCTPTNKSRNSTNVVDGRLKNLIREIISRQGFDHNKLSTSFVLPICFQSKVSYVFILQNIYFSYQ